MIRRRATVTLVALAADVAFGELPNRYHPVAWLGSGIAAGERAAARAGSVSPAVAGSLLLGTFVVLAMLAARLGARVAGLLPGLAGIAVEALLLKQAFACRALFEHVSAVEQPLLSGDLEGARDVVGRIVSRPTAGLDEARIVSAAIESLAENYSDSVIAPIGWYLVAGLPGAFVYRAVNTLDAMVGYPSKGWLGTPSARADDLLNIVPSRATAALFALVSGRPSATWAVARRDHGQTPSPNSGWPISAMAGALDVRLEKPGHHVLNAIGRSPAPADIARAKALAVRTTGIVICLLLAAWRFRGRSR